MMKITGLYHLFKWENLHNWWLTIYFFAPLYVFLLSRWEKALWSAIEIASSVDLLGRYANWSESRVFYQADDGPNAVSQLVPQVT